MTKCQTCGIPLWLAWLLMARPWQERMRSFADATDCSHLLALDWFVEPKPHLGNDKNY